MCLWDRFSHRFPAKSSSNPKYPTNRMKKNCFAFNETRRFSEWNSVSELHFKAKRRSISKCEKNFAGMFVIIMVVTFLIEFRLPNFSRKHPRLTKCSMLVKEEWLIAFHLTFHYIFVARRERRLAGKFFVRLQLWTRSSRREDFVVREII